MGGGLKRYIAENSLDIAKVSTLSGISISDLNSIINQEREMDIIELYFLSRVFDVSVDYLYSKVVV